MYTIREPLKVKIQIGFICLLHSSKRQQTIIKTNDNISKYND